MAGTYTIDASVFLNAFNPHEADYEESHRLLSHLRERATPIIVPTLVLPEVAGAVARGHRDPDLAQRFAAALARLPHLVLVPLDSVLARRAADIAARHRLRGSDAVYGSVALQFASTLVTLDKEQRDRLAPIMTARRPSEVRQA